MIFSLTLGTTTHADSCLERWLRSGKAIPFETERNPGDELPLVDFYHNEPRKEGSKDGIIYLTDPRRLARMTVGFRRRGGQTVLTDHRGRPIDTSPAGQRFHRQPRRRRSGRVDPPPRDYTGLANIVYVWNETNGRYETRMIKRQVQGRTQHSTVVGEKDPTKQRVLFAGLVRVENGVISYLINDSGHFAPSAYHTKMYLEVLARAGADVSQIEVELTSPIRNGPTVKLTGADLLRLNPAKGEDFWAFAQRMIADDAIAVNFQKHNILNTFVLGAVRVSPTPADLAAVGKLFARITDPEERAKYLSALLAKSSTFLFKGGIKDREGHVLPSVSLLPAHFSSLLAFGKTLNGAGVDLSDLPVAFGDGEPLSLKQWVQLATEGRTDGQVSGNLLQLAAINRVLVDGGVRTADLSVRLRDSLRGRTVAIDVTFGDLARMAPRADEPFSDLLGRMLFDKQIIARGLPVWEEGGQPWDIFGPVLRQSPLARRTGMAAQALKLHAGNFFEGEGEDVAGGGVRLRVGVEKLPKVAEALTSFKAQQAKVDKVEIAIGDGSGKPEHDLHISADVLLAEAGKANSEGFGPWANRALADTSGSVAGLARNTEAVLAREDRGEVDSEILKDAIRRVVNGSDPEAAGRFALSVAESPEGGRLFEEAPALNHALSQAMSSADASVKVRSLLRFASAPLTPEAFAAALDVCAEAPSHLAQHRLNTEQIMNLNRALGAYALAHQKTFHTEVRDAKFARPRVLTPARLLALATQLERNGGSPPELISSLRHWGSK